MTNWDLSQICTMVLTSENQLIEYTELVEVVTTLASPKERET